jgi:hypothetical protein
MKNVSDFNLIFFVYLQSRISPKKVSFDMQFLIVIARQMTKPLAMIKSVEKCVERVNVSLGIIC